MIDRSECAAYSSQAKSTQGYAALKIAVLAIDVDH
jgi:hypothetical protein